VGTYPVDDANANIWAGSHRVGWPKSLLKLSISLSVLRELAATGSLYAHPAEGGTSLCASLASAALRLGRNFPSMAVYLNDVTCILSDLF
jgi:hypothetical protein